MSLRISADYTLPLKFLSLRKVIFGGSGSGKTTCGRVLFEEATRAGVLCGAIDLKGDFWGLKSTADGLGDGIPIVIFGGEHQDVPLDENGGAELAEIVVEIRQPFVVDLEQLSKGKQLRFLGAFFERLYDRNREPLVLFCDEADRFAPQKPMSPEANICLGATEDIAKRGRKHGIFPVFITQRNASINKGVSELCDVAIVFRTPGPRDQEAVEDWFGTKATREQRDDVMGRLAGLPTGTAVICSAHPDLKLFATVAIRQPTTFDSSATPEIGKRRIEPKRLAKPDLEVLSKRMAVTIERAQAENPKLLRQRLAEMEGRLKESTRAAERMKTALEAEHSAAHSAKERRVEVRVVTPSDFKRVETVLAKIAKIVEGIGKGREALGAAAGAVGEEGKRLSAAIALAHKDELTRSSGRDAARQALGSPGVTGERSTSHFGGPARAGGRDEVTTGPEQRILDAMAWLESLGQVEMEQAAVAFLAGYTVGGGAFNNPRGALHTKGLIVYRAGRMALTTPGRGRANRPEAALTPKEMQLRVLERLPGPEVRILSVLLDAYPGSVANELLAKAAGYEPRGGAFLNPRGRLRTLGLIEYPSPGQVVARPILFLEKE